MKTILFLLTVVLMHPLFSGEIILEKITSGEWEEWQIRLPQASPKEQGVKTLCIGNSEFQIKFPIIETFKFLLKKQVALFDGKRILSFVIKLKTGEGTFLLPVDSKYFMFEKMIIYPKKKNIWVSNVVPQTKVYTSFFGNFDSFTNNTNPYFICIWEDRSFGNYERYFQTKDDILKIEKVIKKCDNLMDFIDYNGVVYLAPLISKKDLVLCNNCQSCYSKLDMLQRNLSWEVLSFNQGVSGIDTVLIYCKRLFDFYLQHTNDENLKRNLRNKIKMLELLIHQQNILKFKNGEN